MAVLRKGLVISGRILDGWMAVKNGVACPESVSFSARWNRMELFTHVLPVRLPFYCGNFHLALDKTGKPWYSVNNMDGFEKNVRSHPCDQQLQTELFV